MGLNRPSEGHIAGVENGVVLSFPCPRCKRWGRPVYNTGCGCHVCRLCGKHVPARALELLYRWTRSFMPRNLTYN